jgi:hypothetical protein
MQFRAKPETAKVYFAFGAKYTRHLGATMEWKTEHQLGMRITLVIAVWLIIVDLLLIGIAVQLPVTPVTFVIGLLVLASLPVVVVLGYWWLGLRGSSYSLDRNALTITWGPIRQVIPMATIERIVPGTQLSSPARFRGGYWPGVWVGHGWVDGLGLALFYATTAVQAELLFVVTPGVAYAISPLDRAKFLEAFAQRKDMGPTQEVALTSHRPAFFDWPLWSDRLAWGLVGLAGVAVVLLFGFLAWRFQGLPDRVPLHYNLAGLPDRMVERNQVFSLPFIGLLTLLVNGGLGGVVYQRREQFVAYVLWAGALLVQVMLWVAVLGIAR